ncbi:hypothetical protein [Mycolicibacterium brisbanense]|uniref:Plastid-targeted protein 4 n=1 Tax=Mycolicibacterium brisbanense TaxID=146020 RepID=A0A124E159_9MYCO|nr:hypothetical protein [Mycolicibacterium brisbanense]MCV7158007.1 hypothetical protein [Mycolicibacterium brisbanense]GAS92655.1 plastid-targeted protein 4 [Mycolicibacterium brisbanense]
MTDSRTNQLRQIFRQMRAMARGLESQAHEAIAIAKTLSDELPRGTAADLSHKVSDKTERILAEIDTMQILIIEDIGATTKLGEML